MNSLLPRPLDRFGTAAAQQPTGRRPKKIALLASCVIGSLCAAPLQLLAQRGQETDVPTIEPRFTRVYSSEHQLQGPSLSPDGRWIAFTQWGENDRPSLWIVPASGGEAMRLTRDDHMDLHPTWYPSGDRIAFRSDRPARGRSGGGYVMSLPIDSESGRAAGPPRQVSIDNCWAWLDVSPDGEWIVFSRGPLRPAIMVVPSAGGAAKKVAEELTGRPLWSTDGKSIFYDVDLPLGAGSALVRTSVDGKTADTVFTWPGRIGPDFESRFLLREIRGRRPNHPTVWELATLDGDPLGRFELPPGMDVYGATPAGEFVAIRHDGVAPLEVLPIDGGSPQRLNEARGMDKVLGWTPDGQRVLFQTSLDGDDVFFFASTDRGPMRQVRLPERPHDAFAPILSADGRHLLYAVTGPLREATTLKILDIENERAREISRDHFLPKWASSEFALSGRGGAPMRDGDDFLYIERHDDRFELWAAPPAGPSRLLRTFHAELPDHIGVHGERIAYVADRTLMLAWAGEDEARLVTPQLYWDANWSLDGSRLAARDGMILHVLEIDASGQVSGEPTALATPDRWWWSLRWLPNGRGFLVQGENGNVWRISTEPEVRPVAITEDLPSGSVWDFRVSPDGRSIAYARSILQGSSIWRVDLRDALAGTER